MPSSLAVRCILVLSLVTALSIVALSNSPHAQASTTRRGPVYTAAGDLVVPSEYREWIFLSSGLDMSYDAKALASASYLDAQRAPIPPSTESVAPPRP